MTAPAQSSYRPAEIEAIAGWLHDGATASELAALFTDRFRPVSRSAMVGLVHRNEDLRAIGFSRTGTGFSGGRRSGARRQSCPRPPAARPQRILPDHVDAGAYDAAAPGLRLADLGGRACRFPVNDAAPGEPHLFCGLPVLWGRPYCGHHCGRAGAGYGIEAAR